VIRREVLRSRGSIQKRESIEKASLSILTEIKIPLERNQVDLVKEL